MSGYRIVARVGFAAIVLGSAAGCQHGASSPFEPSAGSSLPDAKSRISSSCPKTIDIPHGGQQTCTFSEAGYSGKFYITESARYDHVFTVTPTAGNKKTMFVIQAIDSGNGKFSVKDDTGAHTVRYVSVSG